MTSPTSRLSGLPRLYRALRISLHGLAVSFKAEEAVRIETTLIAVGTPLAFYLGNTASEKLLLAGSLFFILIVELLNTAVERTVDRISADRHDLSGQAKDAASAAVFVAIVLAAMVWGAILLV